MRFLCVIAFVSIVEETKSAFTASCIIESNQFTWMGQERGLLTCYPRITELVEDDLTVSVIYSNDGVEAFILPHEYYSPPLQPFLKVLPTNLQSVLPDLVFYRVLYCSVVKIDDTYFKGLSKLEYLDLGDNKIEQVDGNAFVDLHSLEFLSLSSNKIRSLHENTFTSLKALKELYLEHTEIQVLHPKIFSSLAKVKYVDLCVNKITSFDKNIFKGLTSLESISLEYNKIERLPKDLMKHNLKLTQFYFSGNKLKVIDGDMFDNLPKMRYVDLKNNFCINRDYWAKDFNSMKRELKENCMRDSNLECETSSSKWTWNDQEKDFKTCFPQITEIDNENFTISSSAFDSTTLGFSVINKSGVEFLPTNLGTVFTNLVAIKFYYCSLTSINENHFKGLTKLKVLDLGLNKIDHVASAAFVELVSLELLRLDHNRIQSLGETTFSSMEALKDLYLNSNEIQFLLSETFSSLVNVVHIDLSVNQIVSLDEDIFKNLSSLRIINLKDNRIEMIPKDLLENNLKLDQFYLAGNDLKVIDSETFYHLPNDYYIDMRNNTCINGDYHAKDFISMKRDLENNCTQSPTLEITEIYTTEAFAERTESINTMAASLTSSGEERANWKFLYLCTSAFFCIFLVHTRSKFF